MEVLQEAIERHGKPEIINSDQGSQYTSFAWTNYLEKQEIKISMDGKGRATDNAWIERFWRSIKYNHIYLNPCDNGIELLDMSLLFMRMTVSNTLLVVGQQLLFSMR